MNIPRRGMGVADHRFARSDDWDYPTDENRDWMQAPAGWIWNEKKAGRSQPVLNIPRYGMGDANWDALFAQFSAGAPDGGPDPLLCLKIQCGAISQAEAGPELLDECALAGFSGALSCASPLCAPFCGTTAASVARASQPLPVAPRVEAMFADAPQRAGCSPLYWGPKFGGPYSSFGGPYPTASAVPVGCPTPGFLDEHPFLAVALLGVAAYGVYRWRAGK